MEGMVVEILLRNHHYQVINPWEEEKVSGPEDAFVRDKEAIKECDVLVAYLPVASVGVGIEIALAWAFKKPIVIFASENLKDHPFLRAMGRVVTDAFALLLTLEDFKRTLKEA